jgi:hypothetical protein
LVHSFDRQIQPPWMRGTDPHYDGTDAGRL